MSLHTCIGCDGAGKIDLYHYSQDVGEEGVEFIKCGGCDGKGELEACQCCAYKPSECCCGAWSDVDLDEWYRDDLEEE